jgi:two-component system sensor histidine kinase BaeS
MLLADTVLTGLVLGALNAVAARPTAAARRRFTVLAELTVALTAVVLVVSMRRLGLYEDAYGWTMLRLVAKAGAVWIGVVLLLLAARLGGVARDRDWFVPAATAAGVAVVLALNVVNPEAAVARHNLRHPTDQFDPTYLGSLNDDAVPTIVAELPSLSVERRAAVLEAICAEASTSETGFLGWNRSARRADDARRSVC